ncbi:uncharacterized protein LOC122266495 [Penaeus japonicus]|uniref:uncharacterized protein LOC122266495 n=1 Tax=Penaeus japonicus TaxID=27405 RepID=UPI001C7133B6|nr:uncharacterized protein LOC122266495 [Penaeus japonicus]
MAIIQVVTIQGATIQEATTQEAITQEAIIPEVIIPVKEDIIPEVTIPAKEDTILEDTIPEVTIPVKEDITREATTLAKGSATCGAGGPTTGGIAAAESPSRVQDTVQRQPGYCPVQPAHPIPGDECCLDRCLGQQMCKPALPSISR